MTRNTPGHTGHPSLIRYTGPAIAGLVLFLAFSWANPAGAGAAPVPDTAAVVGDLLVPEGGIEDGAAGATISATPKRAFIKRADRICRSQVSTFKGIEAKVNEVDRRMKEAEAAGDVETLLAEFRRFGVITGSIAPPLVKRKNRIQKLKVVRRARPKAYHRTLGTLITTIRSLSRTIQVFADDPSVENQQTLEKRNARMLNISNKHFKVARKYGFRQCSKPLSVS
jgi:hypothetical protein